MTQPGYQEGSEPMWWWKVALHLDEAQIALANAMAHNLDDQRPVFALQDRLREGQAILLEVFRSKGLLPGSTNGRIEVPMSEMPTPPVPGTVVPVPTAAAGGEAAVAVAVPTMDIEQRPPLAAEEPAVPEADHAAMAAVVPSPEQPTSPEQPAVVPSPEPAAPAAIAPGVGGAGG